MFLSRSGMEGGVGGKRKGKVEAVSSGFRMKKKEGVKEFSFLPLLCKEAKVTSIGT